jgi:MoaA/NifB/PqqE/SkfB family radical SAM enzyme
MQKNEELVRRIGEWLRDGKAQGPYSLHLSPTMACNLNCVFCRRQDQMKAYYRSNKEVPDCKYVEIVREAIALGVRFVFFKGGGEPLLRRHLISQLVPMIKSAGVTGGIVTNGTRIDEDFARLLTKWEWDQLTFSLDGPDAATHDHVRVKSGTFQKIVDAVQLINKVKRETGSRYPQLLFHCVLTNKSYDRLEDYVELARLSGVEVVELDSMSVRDDSARQLLLSEAQEKEFQRLLPAAIARAERYGLRHNLNSFVKAEFVRRAPSAELRGQTAGQGPESPVDAPPPLYAKAVAKAPESELTKVPCYYPFYQVSVVPGGSVVPCCYAEETHRSKSNMGKDSFTDAWLRGDPEEYRAAMRSGKMMPFCTHCTAMYAENNAEIRGWLREEQAGRSLPAPA